ncbi:MAG: hypothetical protein Q9191_008285 [Dirinaria sp. TL-2023a]
MEASFEVSDPSDWLQTTADQELRLRRNWTVEEVVQTFKDARPALLQFNEDLLAAKEGTSARAGKRKREDIGDGDVAEDEAHRSTKRKTRSQTRRDSGSQVARRCSVADSEGDDEDYQPDDGLTACPICSKRMKEAEVFSHLDVHNEPQPSTNGEPSSLRYKNSILQEKRH